jgi:peroxiredoxin
MAFTGLVRMFCAVRDDVLDSNANALGISVDSSFTLAKYKEEQSYNFPLLSDFNKSSDHIF